MILTDLHVHTTWSDGKLTLPEVIDRYGRRGFGAIAITDHICEENSLLGKAARCLGRTLTRTSFPLYVQELQAETERARDEYGMIVIPGFELTRNTLSNSRSAHLLGLGCREFVSADADPVDQARAIHEQGGIAVAAHPVHTRLVEKQTYHLWDRREELRFVLDAWEVASGKHLYDDVLESGLPMLANSDFHRENHMTSWKTLVRSELHPEAILRAICRQDVRVRFYRDTAEDRARGRAVGARTRRVG
jgi:predicted metal-dependent phosphoesterase TrpH